jgi:hypothetical protein
MTSGLRARLGRLEARVGLTGCQWVIKVPEGMDADDALAKLGITPAKNDLVVVLTLFGELGEPALVGTNAIRRRR